MEHHPRQALPPTFLHGNRVRWAATPPQVRTWVESMTGPVDGAVVDCVGGMSNGVAAIVPGEHRAVFVKGLNATANPDGGRMYRREAAQASLLPSHPAIPALLESVELDTDDGTWVINLLEVRPGVTPPHPWQATDLELVLDQWPAVARTVATVEGGDPAQLQATFNGWPSIAADETDPWHERVPHWLDRDRAMALAADGGPDGTDVVLGHLDLRADNLLIDRTTGRVSFLDWAHPSLAAPWVDVALLLADVVASGAAVESGGPIDVIAAFGRVHPDTDPELLIALVSALGAFLHIRSRDGRHTPAVPQRGRWSGAMAEGILPFIDAHQ